MTETVVDQPNDIDPRLAIIIGAVAIVAVSAFGWWVIFHVVGVI